MMKNILLILIIFCANMILTGCWDRTELNNIALIEGVGLDKEQNQFIISAQLNIPKVFGGQAMGGGGGAGDGEAIARIGKGETLAEALLDLQEKLPRKVFWGHIKVIVIGEKLAKEGIREQIDFFSRHTEPRPRAYVFVSKKSARTVMELKPPIERNSSEVLHELAVSKTLMSVTLLDFVGLLGGELGTAALPMVDILPPEKGRKPINTIAYIDRTAIFKKDKMVGEMNDKVTRGVLWLTNEIKRDNITLKPKDANGFLIVNLLRAETEFMPAIEDGKWKMTAKTSSEFDVIVNASHWNLRNPQFIKRLEQQIKIDLNHHMESTLQNLQNEMKTDILGFADVFHRKYPQEWKKAIDDWDKVFATVEVTLNTKVKVRTPGKTNTPQGLPVKEVKKK